MLRSHCLFFALLAFTMNTPLLAQNDVYRLGLENRVTKLEKKRLTPYHPITPSAGPRVKKGLDLFLMGDLLYWTARLDALSYAQTGPLSLPAQFPHRASDHSIDWDWDFGFRVGMGWSFCHGDWDMQLKYTWFYTQGSDSTIDTVHPSFDFFLFNSITASGGASALWDMRYQLGTWEIGRNFFVQRYLKLRPFIGAQGTWQKQETTLRYLNLTSNEGNFISARSRFNQRIWGLGPRLGMNSSWQFTRWAGLYGDFALSGLWLHYDTTRSNRLTVTDTQTFFLPLKKTLRLTKPTIELGLGLRLESYLSCRRLHLLFQVGWETHIWPNQTLYINLGESLQRFDLLLHGGTARLRFDF